MMRINLLAVILICASSALAQDQSTIATTMEEVVVVGEKIIMPTKQANEQVYTGTEITRSGMELPGVKAKTSVYETMDLLPGVQVESVDPLGLAAEQKNTRVRGVRGFLGSMTVEGVPNWGGNPMGPREYIYDMENFDNIAVYKGAIPASLGTGVGARGGAVELRPKWPGKERGLDLDTSVGSNAYTRIFSRVDSGSLWSTETAFSASASQTNADKWKGPGDLGPRTNANFMVSQPYHGDDTIRLWVNHNEVDQDLYRALTYTETRNLSANYDKDFNAVPTGVRIQDIFYYKNNRAEHDNTDVLAVIPFTFNDMFKATVKPYYSNEDANIWQGVTSSGGSVQKRIRDIERSGVLSQVDMQFKPVRLSVGHLFESVDMVINTENYNPVSGAFSGHGIQTVNDDNGYVNSPFASLAGTLGALDWQAGLKYFRYDEPASKGYTSTAPAFRLVEAPDLARDEETYDIWLPTAGVSYRISEMYQPYASYGRSHIRPYSYVPLINLYNANRPRFLAAGVTLADMFEGYDIETSDNVELGLRISHARFDITPTVFYSQHRNLLTTIYDPRVRLNYQQNVGDATGYGFEVASSFYLTDSLTLFVNPTFIKLTYDDNLTFSGSTMATDGNQIVDTPEWTVKAGLIYNYKDVQIIPSLRYLGERYGDAEHKEQVDDFLVADLSMNYTLRKLSWADAVKMSLSFYNLFDREYVSMISASDDTRQGNTSYFVGGPFTAVFSVGVEF